MKRWIALLLAAGTLLSLAACGKKGPETPLTGTAVFYSAPPEEGESPEGWTTADLTAPQTSEDGKEVLDPGTAAPLHDAIAAVAKDGWIDDNAANHDPFYYNGTLAFSDSDTVYKFSYGGKVVSYDHYYAQLPDDFFQTLQGLAAASGAEEDHFRTEPKPAVEPYQIYDPKVMPEGGERDGVKYVAWNDVVEHLFFHPILAYPEMAFSGSDPAGMDDFMVTANEFHKMLDSIYANGYILVDINDVWSEAVGEDGQPKMVKNTLYIPEGKKPLVFSYDDTNYYQYMIEGGLTYKLIIGEDGKITSWGLDPDGNEVISRDLDAIPYLDKFVEEHPDFSPFGAKACLSLTGYEGILGYRTNTTTKDWTDEKEANRQKEIEAVKPIIAELKRTGWTFGSHTWGHIRLAGQSKWKLPDIQTDTQRWFDEVGSLVGPTSILFYPHGERPDGQDWTQTGPIFQYLQSQGFRVFASVGTEPFSYIKKDICAVICDRMHPDGTTLRKSRNRYLRFYDAKEIMDIDVRPDLGVGQDWND